MNLTLEKRFEEIFELVKKYGLDPFPICFEEVPREIIWDTASYGLPTRMSHWSFGRSFLHQKISGEMGFSKIYELIINSDPSIALLDETNDDVTNLLICAHCWGHSDFFKNNLLFAPTNRNMVNQAEQNAKTIDEFKDKYGIDTVEDWMDICFSIDNHIDWRKGEEREKYPPPEHTFRTKHPLPYADLWGEDTKPQVIEEIKNTGFPPHPEKDLIWFLMTYAPQILPWQREVMSIIRSEQFYFYPQGQTKIINEGWASFWHAEIMLNYWNLTGEEHLEFANSHSRIVRPGSNGTLNPYYVGFKILTDIKARWDKYYEEGKKDKAFQKLPDEEMRDDKGKIVMSKLDGYKKLFQVRTEEDDVSFVANYLTYDLCDELNLFVYGLAGQYEDPDDDDVILKDRSVDKVQQALTGRMRNGGAPLIYIEKADQTGLYLQHDKTDELSLDPFYAKKTLEYIYSIWKRPVSLQTHKRNGEDISYEIDHEGITEGSKSSDGSNSRKFQI